MDLHELDVRIDRAGQKPSAMNLAIAQLIDAGKLNQSDALAILDPLRELSVDLADIQAWSTGAQRGSGGGGGGGQGRTIVVDVGDVGDPQGHGPIHAADMSDPNWAFYQQHNLGAKWADIFADTLDEVNAAIGVVPGNLTQYGMGDPVVGNYTLAAFM